MVQMESDMCKIIPGDVVIFKDGGKRSVADAFAKLMVDGKGRFSRAAKFEGLCKTQVNVLISETCLKERRSKTRGVGSLKQLMGLYCFFNKKQNCRK